MDLQLTIGNINPKTRFSALLCGLIPGLSTANYHLLGDCIHLSRIRCLQLVRPIQNSHPGRDFERYHATLHKYVIQKIVQCIFGYFLTLAALHECNIAQWIRTVTSTLVESNPGKMTEAWELALAETMYWVLPPFTRLSVALFLSYTWQFFADRLLRKNK